MATINNNIGFAMSAGVEHVGTKSIAPSGFNDEYGYWRGSKHRIVVEDKFNQVYLAFDGSGVNSGSPRVWDNQGNYYDLSGGGGNWEKAANLTGVMAENAIPERSLFLSEKGFIDAGSGVSTSPYLGVYAKLLPSGNMTDTVITAQHRKNPAQFVLGCDGDGKFYVRSDGSVSGKPVEYYAKSARNFADYDYPVQIVGTYASGDGFLKLYVNGNFEGQSASFTRDTSANASTKTLVGKREFPFDEQGYTGWLDELGVGNRSIAEADVKNLYYSTFDLSRYIRDDLRESGPASSGSISKCGCTTLPTSLEAEITGITLPEGGTNKGAIGEKITLTYDAAATYTDGGSTVHTGIWDSGATSLACGGTVRFRLYCGASDKFYMAHDFSWMSDGEDVSASQVCSPVNIGFALAGTTSGGGTCCSDDAAAEIAVTVTGSPTPQSFGGGSFGADFLAADDTYIHFVVESGVLSGDRGKSARSGSMGKTIGGAYDKTLWGTVAEHAVSSQIVFDLEPSYGNFHQLTDISVEMMVEHLTNHGSGAKLSVGIDKKTTGLNELNWFPSGVMVASGALQKITFTHPLDEQVYRLDSASFKEEFDDHQLRLTVYYPQSDTPYDGEFKIYSTKVNYGSYSKLGSAVSTGSLGPPLFTKGASKVSIDNNIALFVDADVAARSLELFMDATLPELIGGAALLANASVTTRNNTTLFAKGGVTTLETPLYTLGSDGGKFDFTNVSGVVNLETKGGVNVLPYEQKTLSLFLKEDVAESGILSSTMNLFLKPSLSALSNANMNIVTEGHFYNTASLFLKVHESGVFPLPMMMKGPSEYSTSGTMNLFVKQADYGFLGTSRIDAVPSILRNNNTTLNIPGLGLPSGTIPMSMPFTIGKPNNSIMLNIEGHQA